jgi:hypothetical protein
MVVQDFFHLHQAYLPEDMLKVGMPYSKALESALDADLTLSPKSNGL